MTKELPKYQDLEIVKNQYVNREYIIKISIPEFSCVCPRTGLPDYGTIDIHYVPNEYIIELKSLKLYIVKYRNCGVFHEHVTNKILDDFVKACKPKYASITGDFNIRGGIKTVVQAEYKKKIKRKKS